MELEEPSVELKEPPLSIRDQRRAMRRASFSSDGAELDFAARASQSMGTSSDSDLLPEPETVARDGGAGRTEG